MLNSFKQSTGLCIQTSHPAQSPGKHAMRHLFNPLLQIQKRRVQRLQHLKYKILSTAVILITSLVSFPSNGREFSEGPALCWRVFWRVVKVVITVGFGEKERRELSWAAAVVKV